MKQGWEVKKLSELFDVKSSRRVHQSDWKKSGIPFYRAREVVKLARDGSVTNELFISQELYDEFTKKNGAPKTGDIIVSAVGTLGQCYLVKDSDKFYFKDASVLWLENIGNINSRYIEYAFQADSIMIQVMDGSMGATVGTLTISRAKDIEILVPSLPEQQRIVAILDEAFEAIAKAKANAEQNLTNAKELFDSYLQSVFENRGDDWEETNLKSNIDLITGFAFKSKDYSSLEEDVFLLRGDNIMQGNLRFEDVKRWKKTEYDNFKKYQLKENVIVLAMDRPWVKAGLKFSRLSKNVLPALLVQRTACLRNKSMLDNSFLYYLIKSKGFMNYLIDVQTGIGVPHISGQQILDFTFNKPSINEQQLFVQKLDALSTENKRLETIYQKKIEDLEELKKSILEKAFNGEL